MKNDISNELLEFCYLFSNNIKSILLEECNKNGRCNKDELTMPQMYILITIDKKHDCTVTDIVNEMNISKATVSILTTKLELLKLVKKVSDKNDKRITHMILTEKGRNILKNKKEDIIKKLDDRFSKIDKKDLEFIEKNLDKANEILRKYDIKNEEEN